MARKTAPTEAADITAVNGDKLKLNDHVFAAPPYDSRDGVAYSICRIMEFLAPEGSPPKSKNYNRARVAHYFRANEPYTRQADNRLLLASMYTEIVPLGNLRGKCYVAHKDKVANMAEWKKTENCFYFSKFFDPFLKQEFEVISAEDVNNVPPEVKKALCHRYEYIITEKEMIPDLTDSFRTCATCSKWCPSQESVQCDRCKDFFHMHCVQPPLTAKPSKGWGWTCAPCAKRHEDEVDQHGRSSTPRLKDRKTGKNAPKTKTKPDQKDPKEPNKPRAVPNRTVRYWKKWPYRYFGEHTVAEDALDPDDFIYPVAAARVGPRYQSTIPALGSSVPDDTEERGNFGTVQAMACVSPNLIQSGKLDTIMTEVLNKPLPASPFSVAVLDEVLRTITFDSMDRELTFEHLYHEETRMTYPWKLGDIRLYDTVWTTREDMAFEDGIAKVGPDLYTIHKDYIGNTKTMPEVVRYYAAWKNMKLGLENYGIKDQSAKPFSSYTSVTHNTVPTLESAPGLRAAATAETVSDDGGSDVESPHRPQCFICKTKTTSRWWKAPRALDPALLCNECSASHRKYNDSRIMRLVDEARSRPLSDKRDGTPLAAPPAKRAKITPAPPPAPTRTPPRMVASPTPPPPPPKPKPLPPRLCVCCKVNGPGETIVRCQKCHLSLHPACAGFPKEEWKDAWLCDICQNEETLESNVIYNCLLCPKPDAKRRATLEAGDPTYCRAMKPTEGRGWVHIMCATFTPEVVFTDALHMRLAENISCVSSGRRKAQCAVCNISHHGACIKCADCTNEFHLSCAWLAGCTFGFEIQPVKVSRREQHPVVTFKGETGAMSALVWCHAHDRAGRTIYSIGEVDPKTGLTALETFCRTYKQVPVEDSYGLLRKARRLDTVMASRTESLSMQPPEQKCAHCGTDNSPFFWPSGIANVKEDNGEIMLCHVCHFRSLHLFEESSREESEDSDASEL